MKKGIDASLSRKSLAIVDRREAIKTAFALAQSGDIILIAGKGHEKYQEIKGVKTPFDDLEELKETLDDAYSSALRQAALEAFDGIYQPEEIEAMIDKNKIINQALELILID
jgi:predicted Zn-dependent protease